MYLNKYSNKIQNQAIETTPLSGNNADRGVKLY